VAEEYCWAITQAAGRSCCGRSDSRVLELGFTLDYLTNTYLMTMSILNSDVQVMSVQSVTTVCCSKYFAQFQTRNQAWTLSLCITSLVLIHVCVCVCVCVRVRARVCVRHESLQKI
jgi:hypothetical protein